MTTVLRAAAPTEAPRAAGARGSGGSTRDSGSGSGSCGSRGDTRDNGSRDSAGARTGGSRRQ